MSTESSLSPPFAAHPGTPGPRYHPDFTACHSSGLNIDVTLVARDGTRFRINAAALRLASGVFETTLSLPQPVETEWKEPLIDSLDEEPEVLEDLLRIISGKDIDPKRFISLDVLQPRLLAAEKWDMGGVLSIMHLLLLTNPDISSSDPIRVYWLGSHFGWKDVISVASRYTCDSEILLAEKKSLPVQVDATDLLRLMNFHKARKDQMREHLVAKVPASLLSSSCCAQRRSAEYRDFVWKVLQEMDRTPPACKIPDDRLRSMSDEAYLSAACRSCNASTRDVSEIFIPIHMHWDTLQQTMTV